jgi:hypothetical protein
VKKPWTRLVKLKGRPAWETEGRFNMAFLNHHRQACELVFDKQGKPMAAIYFTPQAQDKIWAKSFFRKVQERVLYANEMDDQP